MNRIARTVACSAGLAGAALMSSPAQAAPTSSVGATPSITAVSDGTTVSFTFGLRGTQHSGILGPDRTPIAAPGPLSFSADYGDGKGGTAGDAGIMGCTSKGVAPLDLKEADTYTYAKPGTYKVKVDFWYCGEAKNSHVTKTVDVTVGAKPSAPGTGSIKPHPSTATAPTKGSTTGPTTGSTTGSTKPAGTGHPALPAAPTASGKTAAAGVGPKVNTDGASSSDAALYTGGAALAALAAGGTLVAARRRQR